MTWKPRNPKVWESKRQSDWPVPERICDDPITYLAAGGPWALQDFGGRLELKTSSHTYIRTVLAADRLSDSPEHYDTWVQIGDCGNFTFGPRYQAVRVVGTDDTEDGLVTPPNSMRKTLNNKERQRLYRLNRKLHPKNS
jgi:hypothetical protein